MKMHLRKASCGGVAAVLVLSWTSTAHADEAVSFRTGAISYSLGGFEPSAGVNVTNASLSWEHTLDSKTAVVAGFEFAYSPLFSRFSNQNTFLGLRTFYRTPAWPVLAKGDFGEIGIESRHRWHSTLGIAVGRYLVSVVGEYAALEASSEYFAPFVAGGYDYRFLEKTAIGVFVMPRFIIGFGAIVLRGYDISLHVAITQKL